MPAPTTANRSKLATGRQARFIREYLDRYASKYDDRSPINIHDLSAIRSGMRQLQLRTFVRFVCQ